VKRPSPNLLSAEGLSAVLAILGLLFSGSPKAAAQERATPPAEKRPRVAIYDPGQPVQRKVLKNGVTLLLQEQRTGDQVAGAVSFRMGTFYETDDEAGLSQVLVQTMPAGTTKLSPIELKLRLLSIDAIVQPKSGPDFGQIEITTKREGAASAAALLGEMVVSPSFPDTSFESARQEAVRRASGETESPIGETYNMLLHELYRGSPFERPVAGTVVALSGSRRSDLMALHKKFVVGGNTVVAFVGNFDGKQMMADLERIFGAMPAGPAPTPTGTIPAPLAADTVVTREADYRMQSLAYGFPAPGYGEPDHVAFMLITCYLSSSDRSPLVYWLPTRRIAAGVGVIYAPYPKRSSLSVYLGATTDNWSAAHDSVEAVLKRLTTSPLDEGEWAAQVKRLQTSYFVNQNDPRARASQMSYLEAVGRGYDYPRRFEAELLNLTPEDVRAAAARWFTHHAEATIAPRSSDSKL
jgi:predicted Zn-dependent peptidase